MTPATGNNYEDDALLSAYLLFHYGTPDDVRSGSVAAGAIPDAALEFPVKTVEFFGTQEKSSTSGLKTRALDVGCAVGRSTLELTRIADEAIGIDFSASFVEAANQLRNGESLTLRRAGENHLGDSVTVTAPFPASSATFETGDAMALREDLGTFDFVHAANLLCRLPQPERFLERVPDLIKPGGLFVIATPCTWMDTFTPVENQPPGETLDFISDHLEDHFEQLAVEEIPFAIREHARKIQLSTSQTSLWRRV